MICNPRTKNIILLYGEPLSLYICNDELLWFYFVKILMSCKKILYILYFLFLSKHGIDQAFISKPGPIAFLFGENIDFETDKVLVYYHRTAKLLY